MHSFYAKFSLATDEGYKDRDTGEWVNKVAWHNCITFQKGLVDRCFRKHSDKGRLILVEGELKHDKVEGKDGKEDRYYTSVLIGTRGSVKFLTPKSEPSTTDASAYESASNGR